MTIECYYSCCKHHSINDGEDGPFCHLSHCKASDSELIEFEAIRRKELMRKANELTAETQRLRIEY